MEENAALERERREWKQRQDQIIVKVFVNPPAAANTTSAATTTSAPSSADTSSLAPAPNTNAASPAGSFSTTVVTLDRHQTLHSAWLRIVDQLRTECALPPAAALPLECTRLRTMNVATQSIGSLFPAAAMTQSLDALGFYAYKPLFVETRAVNEE